MVLRDDSDVAPPVPSTMISSSPMPFTISVIESPPQLMDSLPSHRVGLIIVESLLDAMLLLVVVIKLFIAKSYSERILLSKPALHVLPLPVIGSLGPWICW